MDSDNMFCPDCEGKGKIKGLFFTRKCPRCKGTGIIQKPTSIRNELDEDSSFINTAVLVGGLAMMDTSEPTEKASPEIVPGGGEFGGAGASGSWDEDKPSVQTESTPTESEPESPSESVSEPSEDSSSDSGGDSGGGGGDD